MEIWDSGTYDLLEEKRNGGLTVALEGKRLHGTWALVPAHLSGDPKNWLIVRKREESAKPRVKLDYAPMLEIARSLREQIDWDELHRRVDGSAYAKPFFTLVEELGLAA